MLDEIEQERIKEVEKDSFDPNEFYSNRKCDKCKIPIAHPWVGYGLHFWCKDCFDKLSSCLDLARTKAYEDFMREPKE
jgi:hypothetical protein